MSTRLPPAELRELLVHVKGRTKPLRIERVGHSKPRPEEVGRAMLHALEMCIDGDYSVSEVLMAVRDEIDRKLSVLPARQKEDAIE